MSENVRQLLVRLVERDPAIGEDARRCEAVLRDLCRNEHRKEIAALTSAIRERIVADLRAGTSGTPMAALLGRLADRLHDECGLREDLARWAVDSWAIALGVINAGGAATARSEWGQASTDAREEADPKARDRNGVEQPSDAAELNADGVWQETVVANGVPFDLIWVSAGGFWMGSRDGEKGSRVDQRPRHRVLLTRGFWLGKTPVTQGQWAAVMGTNPSFFPEVGEDGPVEQVSWKECQELVQALRRATGGEWRLPTEAEWEYACRAGSKTAWCCGSDKGKLTQYGWYDANAGGTTHPVGQLKPNAWGLYDLHGNVEELVQDGWGTYSADGQTDPTGPSSAGGYRCSRGGSYFGSAGDCRSACRFINSRSRSDRDLGCRLARGGRANGDAREDAQRKARDRNGVERPSVAAEVNWDGVWQETVVAKGVPFELVWVPPGEFWMGSWDGQKGSNSDECPHRRVRLTRGFWLGKTPVTQEQWLALMGTNPSYFTQVGRDSPVEKASWEDCQEFVQALRGAAGGEWRLPTEAEWEYACREGSGWSGTAWCFGDDEGKLAQYAWYDPNACGTTHPVGQLKPNAWGLYDMHGNVEEWVQDGWGTYSADGQTDPTGPSSAGDYPCVRGGYYNASAGDCRSACRSLAARGARYEYLGVRLARVPP